MSSDDEIPFGAPTLPAPPRIDVRNETDLPLQIQGAYSDAGLTFVVRVSPDALPSACRHPVSELVRIAPSIELCSCCGSYRARETWNSPLGSLQHRAYERGLYAGMLSKVQHEIVAAIAAARPAP